MTKTQETARVMSEETRSLLESVAEKARETGEFSSVSLDEEGVAARFIDAEVDAAFRVDVGADGLEVSMKTPDRWLSQSVEATLVNSGDSLEDLIDEELVDLGCEEGPLPIKHFRDEKMRYVFISPAPEGASAETLLACLRAYERAFAPLGDFAGEDDD